MTRQYTLSSTKIQGEYAPKVEQPTLEQAWHKAADLKQQLMDEQAKWFNVSKLIRECEYGDEKLTMGLLKEELNVDGSPRRRTKQ